MPSRNVLKEYGENQFYHVYNRGVDKTDIFRSEEDYVYMLYLLKRCLSPEEMVDKYGRKLSKYNKLAALCCFCLMSNHYHFIIYNREKAGLETLMRSVMTSYSTYFNKKYKRVGSLFQASYKATLIHDEVYFEHISRYIHLNPKDYKTYPYSSYDYFLKKKKATWMHPELLINDMDPKEYAKFTADYESFKTGLDELKRQLADT